LRGALRQRVERYQSTYRTRRDREDSAKFFVVNVLKLLKIRLDLNLKCRSVRTAHQDSASIRVDGAGVCDALRAV
jgi:hypothetical protein